MKKPNAVDLIQQVKDYFEAEYGVDVSVQINIFSSINKHITGDRASQIMQHIGNEIGKTPRAYSRGDTNWIDCGSISDARISIFHPNEPQTC